jgi:hemerythrin-like domain-containing protein
VVTEEDPRPLLRRFQLERSGAFEWIPLESGPETWVTEIVRRAANVGELRRLGEALGWDHDRLDDLAARAFAARAAGRPENARRLWDGFSAGLRRHIRFEEQVLFPLFEAKTGASPDAGPTAVMRSEHRAIERLLGVIAAVIALSDPAADALRAEMVSLLRGHNEKEELVLYPGTDRLLAPEESDALVARLQEQPAIA